VHAYSCSCQPRSASTGQPRRATTSVLSTRRLPRPWPYRRCAPGSSRGQVAGQLVAQLPHAGRARLGRTTRPSGISCRPGSGLAARRPASPGAGGKPSRSAPRRRQLAAAVAGLPRHSSSPSTGSRPRRHRTGGGGRPGTRWTPCGGQPARSRQGSCSGTVKAPLGVRRRSSAVETRSSYRLRRPGGASRRLSARPDTTAVSAAPPLAIAGCGCPQDTA